MNFLIAISKIFQKIDWKIALIIILLAGSITFGLLWYFKDDNKTLLHQLDKENKEIIADRKVIQHQIDSLQAENKKLQNEKASEEVSLQKINDSLTSYITISNKAQKDLNGYVRKQQKINADLQKLQKNPSHLTGDSLLNALKGHLN